MSGIGCRVSGVGCRVSGVGCRGSGVGGGRRSMPEYSRQRLRIRRGEARLVPAPGGVRTGELRHRSNGLVDSYRDLRVWQEAMNLVVACYRLTRGLPADELYGLNSQIRRAAVSIPANIAEGYGRAHRREYLQFLSVSQGSLKELETHLLLCERLDLCSSEAVAEILQAADQLGRMLGGLQRALQKRAEP